jgi:methylated-DNA-[protein]-cysteine S-methyltransferase
MRTSTRPDERFGGLGPVTAHAFACRYGEGVFVLAGELPVELRLPDPAGAAAPAGLRVATGDGHAPATVQAAAAALRGLLERYFAGAPVTFPLDVAAYARAHGLTTFEREVYEALARVPYGTAVSYRELADAAGHPNAYRATGSVMARNELPLLLPCHRVVRNDGRLGQYGSDPAWKERLLTLEGVTVKEGRLA